MSNANDFDPNATPRTAEELRMNALKIKVAELEKQAKLKAMEEKQVADFAEEFLKAHVTNDEIAMVRRLVSSAVEQGKFEAMVYSFPSELCSDSGRAINSGNHDWPDTLQGKAKEFYERYQVHGKPNGYKLKAMIINFPGGVPGEVGFFLSWAPPVAN